MKKIRKFSAKLCAVTLVSAFIIPALFFPSSASACSCMMQPDLNDEALQNAGAVFAGTLVSTDTSGDNSNKLIFDASKTWKGPNAKTIKLSTPKDSAACGWEPEVGQAYLVYANEISAESAASGEEAGELGVNLCSRTFALADAGNDLANLGEGKVPEEGKVATTAGKDMSNLYILGGGILVLGLIFGIYRALKK